MAKRRAGLYARAAIAESQAIMKPCASTAAVVRIVPAGGAPAAGAHGRR